LYLKQNHFYQQQESNIMKNVLFAATAAAMLTGTAASAADVKLEARFADPRDGRADSTEYKVDYSDSFGKLVYGVELQTKQAENEGAVKSAVSAKVGTKVDAPLGFTLTPRAELGHAIREGGNFEFWGAEVKATRAVYGPVSAEVGYRHREGFDAGTMNEERVHAGLELGLTKKQAVGSTYYRTRGTTDSDAVAVYYKVSF
jgi:hypothetical protein